MALAGDHRIQRVPASEKNGRRHSSHVVCVVLTSEDKGNSSEGSGPEVRTEDVRVDTFRASGPGGQHRNKTDSGVRLTHLPTGTVVTATEDRSQHANRKVAWKRLQETLGNQADHASAAKINSTRRSHFDLNNWGENRSWVWCGWRDEVKRPDGKTASMKRSLSGRLAPILSC